MTDLGQLLDAVLEDVAQRSAAIVLERLGDQRSPYLTVDEAADYIRASRQRIYDLRRDGRLSRVGDGTRALVLRAELDELVLGNVALALPPAFAVGSGTGVAA